MDIQTKIKAYKNVLDYVESQIETEYKTMVAHIQNKEPRETYQQNVDMISQYSNIKDILLRYMPDEDDY